LTSAVLPVPGTPQMYRMPPSVQQMYCMWWAGEKARCIVGRRLHGQCQLGAKSVLLFCIGHVRSKQSICLQDAQRAASINTEPTALYMRSIGILSRVDTVIDMGQATATQTHPHAELCE
jgi:hypothetical protein